VFISHLVTKKYLHYLLILTLIFFVMSSQGFSKQIVIKVGSCDSEVDLETTPSMTVTHVFKTIIEQESQGRIKVDIFPNSQLGNNQSMLEQLRRGTLEVSALQNTGLLATYCPSFQVLDLPYIWPNIEVARMVLEGPFGKYLTEELLKASGMRNLAWAPNELKSFSNNVREIKKLEDMKGLRIRCQQIPIYITFVEALGASAIPIPWDELYVALQTGVVDGQFNPPWVTRIASLFEVQKYYTLDMNTLNAEGLLINENFFQSLSPEDQQIIKHAAREAQFAYMGTIMSTTAGHLKFMEEKGVKITTLDPQERERFKEKALPITIQKFKDKIGAEIIDKLFKAIDEAEEILKKK